MKSFLARSQGEASEGSLVAWAQGPVWARDWHSRSSWYIVPGCARSIFCGPEHVLPTCEMVFFQFPIKVCVWIHALMHPCITCYTGSFSRSARMFDRKRTVGMGCWDAHRTMICLPKVRMMRGEDTLVVTNVANKNDRHTFAELSSCTWKCFENLRFYMKYIYIFHKDVIPNDARPLATWKPFLHFFAMGCSIIHYLEFSSAFLEVHQAGWSN